MNIAIPGFVRKLLRIIFRIFLVLLFLLVFIILIIRLPVVQKFITEKALSYYTERVSTPASIGGIYLDFPLYLSVHDLYLEDQAGDTLLYTDRIRVKTDFLALLGRKLRLSEINIRRLNGNVHNSPDDPTFNFQYIVDAFASAGDPEPSDSVAADPFIFEIGEVDISESRAAYYDHYHGILADADLGRLIAEAETFDLDSPLIKVSYLSLQDSKSNVRILEGKPYPPDTVSESNPFHIDGDYAEILNTTVDLFVESAGLSLKTNVGQLNVKVDTLDINRQIYLAEEIMLTESVVALDFNQPEEGRSDTTALSDNGEDESFSLIAGAKKVDFHGNTFRMTDHTAVPSEGFDPARIDLKEIGFSGSGLRMEDLFMSGTINGLHAQSANGPSLTDGGMEFSYGPAQSYIRDLRLETERSQITLEAEVLYPDTSSLRTLAGDVKIAQFGIKSRLALGDLYYFIPSLEPVLNEPPGSDVEFSGRASGTTSLLDLEDWQVNIPGGGLSLPNARVRNIMDPLSADYSVPELNINVEDRLIRRLAGDSLVNAYQFPKKMTITAALDGSVNAFDLESKLSSTIGNMEAWIDYRMPADSIPVYTVSLLADSLDIGHILADTTMGKVMLQANVEGRGLDEEHLQGHLMLDIPYIRLNSYEFTDLCASGDLDGFSYDGMINYYDDHLQFTYDGLVSLPASGGRQDFELDIGLLDLRGLGLTNQSLTLVGKADVDAVIPEDGNPKGRAGISELFLVKDSELFDLDSIGISSVESDSLNTIKFDSRFIDMVWRSNFPLEETPALLGYHIDRYFNTDPADTISHGDEYMDISLTVTDADLLTEALLPDLNYISMEPLRAKFDAASSELTVDLQIDSLSYLSLALDSLGFGVRSTPRDFESNLKIRQLVQGPAIIHHTWLKAESAPGQLELLLKFRDPDRRDKYRMAATMKRVDGIVQLSAIPDSLMINYNDWKIPPDNLVQFSPAGVWFENFSMSWNDKVIAAESSIADTDTVTTIRAREIQLAELTRFNRDSTSLVTGLLDGDINFEKGEGLPGITADLTINDLSVLGEELGEFEVKSGIRTGTEYRVDMSIAGNANNVRITGNYDTSSDDDFSLKVDIAPLSLRAMSVFVSNQLSEVSGNLLGSLEIGGSLAQPRVNGYLSLEDAGFKVNYLQSKLFVNDQRLDVSDNVFRFNNFLIRDREDHEAIIDGTVSTRDFFSYGFNLRATTNEFTFLNSEKGDNDLFYGLLRATSDISIKGNSYLPKVNLRLSLTDESYFTYVIPEATIEEQMQNDVVRFVDRDQENNLRRLRVDEMLRQTGDTTGSVMKGIDLTSTIRVSPQNKLQIVIDPITGDQLTVQGEAMLNLDIRPTGDINLTGRYQVDQGSYNLNFYGLVQREFQIRKGSSIQWTGDPYSARMDVVAEYRSRASPALQSYRSKLEFVVSLFLNGQILQPDISFGLDLAENEPAPLEVQSWLAQLNQDEAELNKQVFGLLILNGFFQSGSNNGYDHIAQNTLRSSVSSLLSGELSKLTNQIEGVELSMAIDSYEDYNNQGQSIGRTQLELGVSKNFFNDRVVVKVAGNIDLEGSNAYRNNVSDFAGDIRIEYKLTEDGRFRLVGFRETNYDDLLQGEIVKTGGGFIYVKNYNAFRELFRKDHTGSDE